MRRRKLISVFGAMALMVAMLPGCKSESEEPESSASMQENSQSVQESQEPESTETVRTPDYQYGGISINENNFPDEGFRRYISENMDDDRDGALSSDELTEFKNQTIKITEEYEVKDLTGIEFFPDLQQLEIARQDLKRLDVSHNKQLYRLECQLDQMTELILDNPALKQLDCMGNQLDQLDLSKVPNLSILVCNDNKISTLDMKQVPNLQHLECSSNPLGSLDLSENLYLAGLICADAQLTSLNVSRNLLLSELLCNNNNLTELNVANNSMLYQLNCEHNQLTKLDVSNNTKLSSLSCNDNRLVTLDASKNRDLWSLFCQNNALTELVVAGSSLSKIYCENNQLTDLDVSHCGSMVRVRADYDVEIEGKIMAPVGPSDILVDAAHFPDPAFLDFVYEEYDLDGNRALSEEEREAVEEMELYVNSYTVIMDGYTYQGGSYIGFGIHDLTGIEYFPYLQILNCKANQIERLDLTQNPALVYLECDDNALQTLDVSNNPELGYVSCKDNALTCVDVSRCDPEIEVRADEGVEIIWPEGHVDVPVPESTQAESTPEYQGEKIVIDEEHFPDEEFRRYLLDNIDDDQDGVLSEYEQSKYEHKFFVISEEYNVKDLSGIEFFRELKSLECSHHELTRLDVSQNKYLERLVCEDDQLTELIFNNPYLTTLRCEANQLESLDLSKTPVLEILVCLDNNLTTLDTKNLQYLHHLECDHNPLGMLDVSGNLSLSALVCCDCQLSTLDVSRNLHLEVLICKDNNLTELNVADNYSLYWIDCGHNQLTELNVEKNSRLMYLKCNDNLLTTLDLSNNTGLYHLYCQNNQLTDLTLVGRYLENIYCENNKLTKLDVMRCSAMVRVRADYDLEIEGKSRHSIGPNDILLDDEHFPDPEFRNYIFDKIDLDGNSALTEDERAAVKEMQLCQHGYDALLGEHIDEDHGFDIHDLTGIEYFPNLTSLTCNANEIERLDLSKNTALTYLECVDVGLLELNVSNIPNLHYLSCKKNKLTRLDVSHCPTDIIVVADEGVEILRP